MTAIPVKLEFSSSYDHDEHLPIDIYERQTVFFHVPIQKGKISDPGSTPLPDQYHSHDVIIPNFVIQSAGSWDCDWHVGDGYEREVVKW